MSKPVTVEEIKAVLEQNDGPLYQTHAWRGEVLNHGIRCLTRRSLMDPRDVRGKRVLDLGCATGSDLLWCMEQGAKSYVGVDSYPACVATATKLAQLMGGSKVAAILAHDLKLGLPPVIAKRRFDTVICCSLTHHTGHQFFWEEIEGATVCYFETGPDHPYTLEMLVRGGWTPVLLGQVPVSREAPADGPRRCLYRLSR